MVQRHSKVNGFRSGFEKTLAQQLAKARIKFGYETLKIRYSLPSTKHTYTPDFILPNGIIIEAKGKLDARTRLKMECVKECNPDLDIRFVFMRASNKIYRGSKTSYGDWADKAGYPWADKEIPKEWLK